MKTNVSEYFQLPILDGIELLNAKSHTLDFPFHTHDTFNIALILDNTFNTKLSSKFLKAPKGTLSITNPDEVHATPCDTELGNSFFTFYISPDVFKKLNKNIAVFFEDKIIFDEFLFKEFFELSTSFLNYTPQYEKRLYKTLELLISKYASIKPFQYKTTQLFQDYIQSVSFTEEFSLEKTAHQFGLNKFKFLRLFKQETGLTPNNYILLQRVENSKKMLKQGKPIFNTAIDNGFYDNSHFNRNFKKFTGVTPSEYQSAFILE